MVKVFLRSFLVAAVALCAACSVHESDAPALSGPSGGIGILSPPTQTPTARFTFAPAAPAANSLVSFDGGSSCIGQTDPNSITPCSTTNGSITVFTWSFGDGAGASGAVVSHSFDEAGTFPVRLTVTNNNGLSSSTTHTVTVGAGVLPTAAFTLSTTAPAVNATVVLNASTSVAGLGHTLAVFAWEFGDNTAAASGSIVTHAWTFAGTYVVTLTVGDDAGQTATTTRTISVGAGLPVPVMTSSPGSPHPGDVVQFNSNGTTYFPGSGPGTFAWTFGDGGTSTLANPTHVYVALGSYSVGLSVTDNLGRTGTGTITVAVVAVTPPASPVAAFTSSPPSPSLAAPPVFFDGSTSSTPSGAAINNYRWNFGDGTIISGAPAGAAPAPGGTFLAPRHTYTATGSYTVTLTVTDTNGLTGSTTGTVTVGP